MMAIAIRGCMRASRWGLYEKYFEFVFSSEQNDDCKGLFLFWMSY